VSLALGALMDRLPRLSVLVVGEAILDVYLEGSTTRLCREAPVPIVALTARTDAPGGAANVASNVQALGGRAVYLSVVGDDAEGARLRRALGGHHVPDAGILADPERATLTKQRVLAEGQLVVRFDQGTTADIAPRTEDALIERLEHWQPRVDAVIVSDYGYGVLTDRVIARLAELQRATPRLLVVDAKDYRAYRRVKPTVAKPNFEEATRLLGQPVPTGPANRADIVTAGAQELLSITGAALVVVTLDRDGAVLLAPGGASHRALAGPVRHARTAGAGDTFGAAFTLALAAEAAPAGAMELATVAASIVVSQDGTAVCSERALRRALQLEPKALLDRAALALCVTAHRAKGRRIVLTNGCFDILHRGHVSCLNLARSLGDVLFVGLNSDAGVRRLKGAGRPVNSLEDRVHVLAALGSVDHVVPFDEDTPDELIRAIRPDVFVKGGDYSRQAIPEAALVESLGGTVEILPYVRDRSTTGIIARIRTPRAVA
jgi:D-beta-D-heptose 7-phosphate kinase/D-beta-D-heptose 1-phosphate adenosyltransferase